MNDKTKILGLLAVLAIVGIGAFVRGSQKNNLEGADSRTPTAVSPTNPADPSGDNVGHSFLVKERSLVAAVTAAPEDTLAIRELANFYHDAHKFEQAIELYQRYLAIAPLARQQLMDLANCFGSIGDWASALSSTESIIEKWPDDMEAWYNLGAIHANNGSPVDAARAWHHILDSGTDSSMVELARNSLSQLTGST